MKVALAALLFAAVPCFPAAPRVVFIKSFPGSVPAYVWIAVDKTGSLEYKESEKEDEQPVKAQLPDPDVAGLFSYAEKLAYFKAPIESGLKVANTGKKTFRYEPETGTPTEAVFNYSIDVNAQHLLEKFEQIAASERCYIDLDRTVHFDKLGVNDALAEIESLWLRKQLAAPLQFVPLLDRISSRPTFMHLARERAARLKDQFTGTFPQATPPNGSDGKPK
ncbi:MAG: hypothetical protein ACJ746_23080 [Bryobacteraceae bacterium]